YFRATRARATAVNLSWCAKLVHPGERHDQPTCEPPRSILEAPGFIRIIPGEIHIQPHRPRTGASATIRIRTFPASRSLNVRALRYCATIPPTSRVRAWRALLATNSRPMRRRRTIARVAELADAQDLG